METLNVPSAAHVILEAVRLTLDAEIATLRQLTTRHPGVLNLDLTLRILLTFLPESTDPAAYTGFLQDALTSSDIITAENILPYEADNDVNHRVHKLHLLPLADPQYICEDSIDSFTLFLLHQAHKIDAETGSLNLVLRLIEPFIEHSEHLRTWAISTFLPLLRLDYEYYPHDGPSYSLETFEALTGHSAISALLSKAAQNEEKNSRLERDLRSLIGPWMYGASARKRRKLNAAQLRRGSVAQIHEEDDETEGLALTFSGWAHVNEWLLDLAGHDFARAVEAFLQWDGPRDVDYGQWDSGLHLVKLEVLQTITAQYAQTGLGAFYTISHCSFETLKGSHQILQRVAKLMDLHPPPDLSFQYPMNNPEIPVEFLDTVTKGHLLHNSLLRVHNPFTTPTNLSLRFSYLLLESSYILENLGSPLSCKILAELSLFGNETEQKAELHKVLYELRAKPRDEEKWNTARKQILWLRDWNGGREDLDQGAQPLPGVFSRVKLIDLEDGLLTAFLNSSCYNLAIGTYCKHSPPPIPTAQLEKTVVSIALASYDGASNGNRTRGGVRNASEIIMAFRNYFPHSEFFNQVLALISATHAMSFYSLTLQHGVPFQPVNIRAHKDPISLVGKILDQNNHSYTKLDDLLEIGQNLASAGLTHSLPHHDSVSSGQETLQQQRLYVKRRITALAIEAALIENDFETAYSYVVNRLSPPYLSKPSVSGAPDAVLEIDDISWRAAYQAGRHRPINESGSSTLRRLEQCMELLSQALLLAPSSALTEVLVVWCQCEEEMNALTAREAEAEDRWDDKGDRRVPGGFSGDSSPKSRKARDPHRNALNEEVPMGLFDVARGAAAALSKNAFPLRGNRSSGAASPLKASHERPLGGTSGGGSESSNPSGMESEGRVRKRDMVSNMVTGGLASGIGWVIGAPPVRQG